MSRRFHITVLIIAFIYGIGAAALDVDRRLATLIGVALYGLAYAAMVLFRRYKETRNA